MVRLASRSVIGAFERSSDVESVALDLQKLGIRPVDISVLGSSEVLPSIVVHERRGGLFGIFGRTSNWLSEARSVERQDVGTLTAIGPLADILASSPSTSLTGALVMQGIPQQDALIYAELLKTGKIVALVGVADRKVGERIRAVLERRGGQAVMYYAGRPYGTAFHGVGPGLH